MELEFRELTLNDAEHYTEYWNKCGQQAAIYSFSTMWSWGGDFCTKVAYDADADIYWIRENKMEAPMGNWNRSDWAELLRSRWGSEVEFSLVPEALADIWQEELSGAANVEISEDRGNWEYLYDIHALASLAGRKYMKKRNHVNKFRREVPYTYEAITADNADEVLAFQRSWYQTNAAYNSITLAYENRSLQNLLSNWDKMPSCCGGLLRSNGRIIAYSTGEITKDTLIVHYEKSAHEYAEEGGYQVINQEFLQHTLDEFPSLRTVNREEDMDDQGLRTAKMSYLPSGFIKEYSVKIKFK